MSSCRFVEAVVQSETDATDRMTVTSIVTNVRPAKTLAHVRRDMAGHGDIGPSAGVAEPRKTCSSRFALRKRRYQCAATATVVARRTSGSATGLRRTPTTGWKRKRRRKTRRRNVCRRPRDTTSRRLRRRARTIASRLVRPVPPSCRLRAPRTRRSGRTRAGRNRTFGPRRRCRKIRRPCPRRLPMTGETLSQSPNRTLPALRAYPAPIFSPDKTKSGYCSRPCN